MQNCAPSPHSKWCNGKGHFDVSSANNDTSMTSLAWLC